MKMGRDWPVKRIIEIREREAYRVRIFMDQIATHEKTLVFSATQDHALVVRGLINQLKTGKDPNYCAIFKITTRASPPS